jgi:hypothetical protein
VSDATREATARSGAASGEHRAGDTPEVACSQEVSWRGLPTCEAATQFGLGMQISQRKDPRDGMNVSGGGVRDASYVVAVDRRRRRCSHGAGYRCATELAYKRRLWLTRSTPATAPVACPLGGGISPAKMEIGSTGTKSSAEKGNRTLTRCSGSELRMPLFGRFDPLSDPFRIATVRGHALRGRTPVRLRIKCASTRGRRRLEHQKRRAQPSSSLRRRQR